jgi:hypothetical protein
MAMDELNAQTEVMDILFNHASEIKGRALDSHLLNDPRYAKPRANVEEALRLLVQAQNEIGAVPRIED